MKSFFSVLCAYVAKNVVVITVFVSLGLIALAIGPFLVASGRLPVASA